MRLALLLLAGCAGEAPGPTQAADSGAPCAPVAVWADADGDGYGDPFTPAEACAPEAGWVENRDDCDDTDAEQHPGQAWFRDVDGDGYGDPEAMVVACARPVGHLAEAGDCDDGDSQRHPGAVWYADADGDGFGDPDAPRDGCEDVSQATPAAGDCDDDDWRVHPDALEVCDGVDNDCDERVDDDDDSVDPYTQVPVFRDDDGDGYGTDESLGRACPGGVGATVVGDCDDTDPEVHPHRLDYNDDLDSDCDGEPGSFSLGAAEGGWVGDVGSGFGVVVRSRDLDGDGHPELLVNAYNRDTEANDVGAVHLIDGAQEGDRSAFPTEGVRSWTGTVADGHLGWELDFVGDWDGDGHPDLVASAPWADGNDGAVVVWAAGRESGDLVAPLGYFPAEDEAAYFGYGLAAVGDVDGDGRDDVVVGARHDDRAGYRRGSATLLLGGSTTVGDRALFGRSNADQLGYTVAHVGDMDGDGVGEVALGAPYGDAGDGNSGEVAVVSAATFLDDAPHLDAALVELFGEARNGYAGMGLAGAGDFDGDGLDDLVIGAAYHDLDAEEEGRAYVVLGQSGAWASADLADAFCVLDGATPGERAGRWVSGPGDLDGDGRGDVFVSAYRWTGDDDYQGRSYGLLGRTECGALHLGEDADLIFEGEGRTDYAGRTVASAGDADGDGVLDLWVGASGAGSTGSVYRVTGALPPW